MAFCTGFDPLAPYVPAVVAFVDCHARALGEDGYRALGFGSPTGMVIRGFITIYIALIGYRMLFGDLPRMREVALAAVRIGAVLALATQWPAYKVLVYNVVIDEPAALAARIVPASGLGGADAASLAQRIQGAYEILDAIVHPSPGASGSVQKSLAAGSAANAIQPAPVLRRNLSIEEAQRLSGAEQVLLVASLTGLLSTRIVAAVLLALGPLFMGFFLFDATRGLVIGWVRALVATVIAGVGAVATLSIGLALIEPQVASLYKSLADGYSVPALIGEVIASIALLALLVATTLLGTGIAAFGLRLPDAVRQGAANLGERLRGPVPVSQSSQNLSSLTSAPSREERSRAQLVADAVGTLDRRDEARSTASGDGRTVFANNLMTASQSGVAQPMGQGPNRTTRRYSARARQRDLAE